MITTILISLLMASSASESAAEQPALQCNIGPTVRQFGGNDWLVYGCADGRSVVAIAGSSNPAAPFVFIIAPDDRGGIELHGEGSGAKTATQPAHDALSIMSSSDLAALFEQARQSKGR